MRDFAEWAWGLLLETGDDYTEYAMLKKQDRKAGYLNGPVVLEGGKRNLMPGADPSVDSSAETVDDDEDCDFDGAIGGESA